MPLADNQRNTPADIAIVVPVLGDAARLRTLLDLIAAWTYKPREIVVVAADADTQASALCDDRGCRYITSNPCRGKQQDMGARAADADILWFLHADATPGPSNLGDIARTVAGGAEGGHFKFAFSGSPMRRKAAIEWLTNLRVRLGGIPYGDQGIFVRRDIYLKCGGFPHQPLFEEVSLVRKLRSRGRFKALAAPLGVSPRRWERDGWIRRCLNNRYLALAYARGQTAHRVAARYKPSGSSNCG
ncbi:MAG: glycosyltransferase [Proteobacteria bacterium]|nr:glycosyltransferase [Pseudomonadota bacterium]